MFYMISYVFCTYRNQETSQVADNLPDQDLFPILTQSWELKANVSQYIEHKIGEE